MARVAKPHERGAVFALANVINYLGNRVPAVLGGIAVTNIGLRTAAEIYALAIAVITFAALALRPNQVRVERHSATTAEIAPCS
ncbi:hypothetical protein ACFC09_00245 [Streptomyces sp. NPDC056161]|uniref:hypothetical protein n=1 Tax=Streptomyces sp. NPDC056161 TaxID=3345732 RepID=UPI0035DD3276